MSENIQEHFTSKRTPYDHQIVFSTKEVMLSTGMTMTILICSEIEAWGLPPKTNSDLKWEDNIYGDETFVHIRLHQPLPWHKRVMVAVKYIIGSNVFRWHYDDMILKKADAARMRSFLDKFIQGQK